VAQFLNIICDQNGSLSVCHIQNTEEISDWINNTWTKYQVNLLAFAYDWINNFYDNEEIWPSTHRKKSQYTWRKYDYDYKQKSNLFNIDSLYRRIPKKPFIKGRKQEFEILFMYYWLHDMVGDDEGYWQQYLETVLPACQWTGKMSPQIALYGTGKMSPSRLEYALDSLCFLLSARGDGREDEGKNPSLAPRYVILAQGSRDLAG
jgi:hypothetical protein